MLAAPFGSSSLAESSTSCTPPSQRCHISSYCLISFRTVFHALIRSLRHHSHRPPPSPPQVIRTPIIEPNHASLSYQDGLSAAAAVTFGELHFTCVDFFVRCFSYLVTPLSDPLYMFPPSSFLPFAVTYDDLPGVYLALNLSVMEENTLVMSVSFSVDGLSTVPNPYSAHGIEQVSVSSF